MDISNSEGSIAMEIDERKDKNIAIVTRSKVPFIYPCAYLDPKVYKKILDGETVEVEGSIKGKQLNYFDCSSYFFDGKFIVLKMPKNTVIYHGSFHLANANVNMPLGKEYYDPELKNKYSNPIPKTIINNNLQYPVQYLNFNQDKIPISWYGNQQIAKGYSKDFYVKNTEMLKYINSMVNELSKKTYFEMCGDKAVSCINLCNITGGCVFSYKLKYDTVFFLLSNAYNLYTVLKDLYSQPQTNKIEYVKRSFSFAFLGDANKDMMFELSKKSDPLGYIDLINPFNRRSDRPQDMAIANYICSYIVKKNNYAGYAANNIPSTHHGSNTFHLEIILCNPLLYIERTYSNDIDWQFMKLPDNKPTLKLFFEQLRLYETLNYNFHAGNLFEHSIWTLLFSEQLMKKEDCFRVGIMDNTKIIIALSAFLHDIGKMIVTDPDKKEIVVKNQERKKIMYLAIKNHPEYGFSNLLKNQIPILDDKLDIVDYFNTKELITEFVGTLPQSEYNYILTIVSVIIKYHWDIGNLIKNVNSPSLTDDVRLYITSIIGTLKDMYTKFPFDVNVPQIVISFQVILGLVAVSISDVLGSRQFGYNRLINLIDENTSSRMMYCIFNDVRNITSKSSLLSKGRTCVEQLDIKLNATSKYFNFITNVSAVYSGSNLSYSNEYKENTKKVVNLIINNIRIYAKISIDPKSEYYKIYTHLPNFNFTRI
jgi:hypothetical protein